MAVRGLALLFAVLEGFGCRAEIAPDDVVSGYSADGGMGGSVPDDPGQGAMGGLLGAQAADAAAGSGARGGGGAGGGPSNVGDAGGALTDAGATMPILPQCDSAICEDFEALKPGTFVKAGMSTEGGRPADYNVSSEQTHSGTQALKIVASDINGPDRLVKIGAIASRLNGGKDVFARVWMFFPVLPQLTRPGQEPHYRLLRFDQTVPAGDSANINAGIVGKNKGRMLYFKHSSFRDCADDGAVLPENTWSCIELRSTQTGFTAWIDGIPIGSRTAAVGDVCWEKHDRVDAVSIGFQRAAGGLTTPLTFFIDDIAVSDKRIGCK